MTDQENKTYLENLLNQVDKDYQTLLDVQKLSMDYLSKDGVNAKKAYRVIWECLIFADTKEEAKAKIEKVIDEKDSPAVYEMNDEILHLLERFLKHNFE